jgi:hypothetical protein
MTLRPVLPLLVTISLAWGCATATPISTSTAAEELRGIEARLEEMEFRQMQIELRLEVLRERLHDRPRPKSMTDAQMLEVINELLGDVAEFEPVLAHIEGELIAVQAKHPGHPEPLALKRRVDSIRKVIYALLDGQTLPPMTDAEAPVTCPGTSWWNGRGCTSAGIQPTSRSAR